MVNPERDAHVGEFFGGVSGSYRIEWVSQHISDFVAEPRHVNGRVIEDVAISYDTPNIEKLFASLDSQQIIVQELGGIYCNAPPWPNQRRLRGFGEREIKPIWNGCIYKARSRYPDRHFLSRSTAGIFDAWMDGVPEAPRSSGISMPFPSYFRNEDERALQFVECIFGGISAFSRRVGRNESSVSGFFGRSDALFRVSGEIPGGAVKQASEQGQGARNVDQPSFWTAPIVRLVAVLLLWDGLVIAVWGPGSGSVLVGTVSVAGSALLWVMGM